MSAQLQLSVIGAGIVSVAAALHLQRASLNVTLVDAAGIGQGCSWGNARGISPGAIVPAATPMFKELPRGATSAWMGMRPSLPDSIPVIDRHPSLAQVFFAFGHGHLGFSGAPAAGRLVADLVLGRQPSIEPSPFRHTRFAR